MYVCLCHGVTDSTIRNLMEKGSCSVRDVQKRCLAGTDCGACIEDLTKMVEGQKEKTSAG